ncbi:MAG: hypothetical protein ABW101_01750 [Candidatus Thiodiazotropha sp.]
MSNSSSCPKCAVQLQAEISPDYAFAAVISLLVTFPPINHAVLGKQTGILLHGAALLLVIGILFFLEVAEKPRYRWSYSRAPKFKRVIPLMLLCNLIFLLFAIGYKALWITANG